jgi:PAS domain-containing protein
MQEWLDTLRSALDEVDYGIVLLDRALNTRFINRAFYRMWALPVADGKSYRFEDLVRHASSIGIYEVPPAEMDAFVRERVAAVRAGRVNPSDLKLTDGRILRFECVALKNGGRMLIYADVT